MVVSHLIFLSKNACPQRVRSIIVLAIGLINTDLHMHQISESASYIVIKFKWTDTYQYIIAERLSARLMIAH